MITSIQEMFMHNGYKNYPCVSFFAEMCLYVDEREEKKKWSDTEFHTEW